MSTKHTPGPWRVEQDGNMNPNLTFRICGPWIHRKSSARQPYHALADTEANARLIAAAPELLEALKLAYQQFDDAIHCRRPSMHPLEYAKVLRAAIAKAEGRS